MATEYPDAIPPNYLQKLPTTDGGNGVKVPSLAQTRSGRDEFITPITIWERQLSTGLYLPPGVVADDNDVGKPRVKTSSKNIVAINSSGEIIAEDVREYRGESTDTKPTTNVPLYSTFVEMDKRNIFYWNGTGWVGF
ncbi:MAG: hypothetical protein MI740_10515 [Halanaerobiales bacterium]|nr:hypothetical protein [Halanaerobiales bacterium]